MLIGRLKEQELLKEAWKDGESHFIAVYGRLGIGKTFLIREVFKDNLYFGHAGIYQGRYKEQLMAFSSSLKEKGYVPTTKITNWFEAFEELKCYIKKDTSSKKVIFLDELSWMDTPKSDMLKALEAFWNSWASARKDIVLIVCASATSWMLSKVIHNKGGLYNRLTEKIHLKGFSLIECESLIQQKGLCLNRSQILEGYMVFGGVPFYWNQLKKGLSMAQNIDQLIFSEEAVLKEEYEYLLGSLFKNPAVYKNIIETLGQKKSGLTREEIIKEAHIINSGDLTHKLEELESCGFIRSYHNLVMEKKNTLYQLIDNFTLFYYQIIIHNHYDEHFYSHQLNTPLLNTWKGLSFERVCLNHINNIKEALGIAGVLTDCYALNIKPQPEKNLMGSQIDLIIVRKDQVINLCEMKYSLWNYTIDKSDVESINRKIHDLMVLTKNKYAIYPVLITPYGIEYNSYADIIQNVITLDILFK